MGIRIKDSNTGNENVEVEVIPMGIRIYNRAKPLCTELSTRVDEEDYRDVYIIVEQSGSGPLEDFNDSFSFSWDTFRWNYFYVKNNTDYSINCTYSDYDKDGYESGPYEYVIEPHDDLFVGFIAQDESKSIHLDAEGTIDIRKVMCTII